VQRHRLDLGFDEFPHRVAEFQLLGGEVKVIHIKVPSSKFRVQGSRFKVQD